MFKIKKENRYKLNWVWDTKKTFKKSYSKGSGNLSEKDFLDILNRDKFSKLISNGKSFLNESYFEIMHLDEDKGEITIFFDKEKYDLKGWRLVDVNNNITILEINNYVKNLEIKKNFFLIPEENQ